MFNGSKTARLTPRLNVSASAHAVRFTRSQVLVAAFVVLVFIAARTWQLTTYGLFGDEVFSLWATTSTWRDLFDYIAADVVHPPLFYVLLKVWVAAGGYSLLWVKLFPLTASIATVIPFFLLCRELNLCPWAANLSLGFIALNGFLSGYAQELRMYSLLLLFAVCSLWLFARLVNLPKAPRSLHLWLLLANLLLVYTHYYGWLIVGAELVFLTIWDRNKAPAFLIASAALVACFAPWAYVVSQAGARKGGLAPNLWWNPRPGLTDFFSYYAVMNGAVGFRWKVFGVVFQMLLFSFPIIVWGRWVFKKRDAQQKTTFWWLATFSFLPAVVSFAASHLLGHSVWGIRYLIISAPAYMILLASSATSLPWPSLKRATLALMIGLAALSGCVELANKEKIAWEPLVRQMIAAESDGSVIVYTDNGNLINTIQFYLEQAGETRFQVVYADNLASLEGDHFWVSFLRYKSDSEGAPQRLLGRGNYQLGEVIEAESSGQKAYLLSVTRR